MYDDLKQMAESALLRGLYDEAERLYRRELQKHGDNSDDPIVADCLRGMAMAHLGQGRFVDAEKAANRALAIDEDYWGGGCLQVGEAYFLMGEASRLQGFLGRSEFFYLEALPHRIAHLGPTHVDVAQVQARLALLGLIHGLYPDLREMILGCYKVYEATPSTSEFIEFLGLPAMLRFFSEQNRRVEAESLYKNSMEALEAALGRSHRELGNLQRSWAFYAGSSTMSLPTLNSWQKRVTSSVAVDENLEKRAEQHIVNLEYDKAENVYLLQLRLGRERFGEFAPEVRRILANYATLLRRWERTQDAVRIEKMVQQNF
ncbi:hypothetical protein BH11CYA1_BH11CYA1_30680 [soil metagenome]